MCLPKAVLCEWDWRGGWIREGVARQGPSALNLHRVQGSWCAGEWASQETSYGTPTPSPTCAHTASRGPPGLAGGKAEGLCGAPLSPLLPFLFPQPPGGSGTGCWEGQQELSLEPTPASSVGAWKPLGAWAAPGLPLARQAGDSWIEPTPTPLSPMPGLGHRGDMALAPVPATLSV